MTVELDHTIVHSADREIAAGFLAELFGLARPETSEPFLVLRLANGVSLDFMTGPRPIAEQHYAFLVAEADFGAILARIRSRGIAFWSDPLRRRRGEIHKGRDGRGLYFLDPSGHSLEILTRSGAPLSAEMGADSARTLA